MSRATDGYGYCNVRSICQNSRVQFQSPTAMLASHAHMDPYRKTCMAAKRIQACVKMSGSKNKKRVTGNGDTPTRTNACQTNKPRKGESSR
jgi:hypothetical protein